MTRKRLILSTVGLLVALLVLPVLFLQYFNWNDHRDRVASWVGTAIQREVQISGRLGFQLWPTTKLSVSGLEISSPQGVSDLPLLKLQSGEAEFTIWPLLSGILVIDRLELDSPAINFVSGLEEGTTNWRFRLGETAEGRSFAGPPLIVRELQVRRADVQYSDPDPQFDQDLHLSQLDWVLPEDAYNSTVTAVGTLNGSDLEVNGALTLVGEDDLEAALNLVLGKISGEVGGSVTEVMQGGNVDMRLALETSNLTQSVAMFVPGLTEQEKGLFSGTARAIAAIRGRPGRDLRLEDVDVTTRSSLLRLTASGGVSLVRRHRRGRTPSTRFQVLAETDALSELVGLYDATLPFKASAEARGVLTGSLGNFRIDEITVSASSEYGSLSANGFMERLGGTAPPWLEFTAKAQTAAVGRLMQSYGMELLYSGSAHAIGTVSGHPGDVHVRELDITLSSDAASVTASGSIGPLGEDPAFDLPFKIDARDLALVTEPLGLDVPEKAHAQMMGRLIGKENALSVSNIKLSIASDPLNLTATGDAGPIGKAAVFNMPVTVESDDLPAAMQMFGYDSPISGKARLSAVLTGRFDTLGLEDLSAQLDSESGQFRAQGRVSDVGPNAEFDLGINVVVSDIAQLRSLLEMPLDQYPDLSLSASAKLLGQNGKLRLSGVDGMISGEGIRFGRFSGQIPDLTYPASGSVNVDLAVDDLGVFTQPLGLEMAKSLPARLSGNIVGSSQRESPLVVIVEGISDDAELHINAKVNPFGEKTTFALDAQFQTEAVSNVNEIFGTAIPLEGPLSLGMVLRRDASQDAKTASGRVQVSASGFDADAKGDFSWPLRAGNALSLTFETPSLANLSRWLPGEYLDPGPVSFESNFEIDSQNTPVGDFALTLGNNDLSGDAHLQGINLSKFPDLSVNPGEKIRITGALESSRLNMIEILPPRKRIREDPKPRDGVFSNDPLEVAWLDHVNLDVKLDADDLLTRGFEARGLKSRIRASDGKLEISARSGEFSGGTLDMDIELDTRQSPYAADLAFDMDGLILNRIPALKDVQLPLEGSLDVAINLSGQGGSSKEIMSTASGSFLARGDNTYIPATGFDLLTNSILVQIFSAINPKKKSEFHQLDCGVIGFRVVDGIAMSSDSIALQTQDVTYLIRGGFSLKDESLVFLINPKARKGFGVSAANLTNFYRIGGNLLEPKVQADPEGILKTALRWGLAFFSAGGSVVLEGLFDKFTSSQDVCALAESSQERLLAAKPKTILKAWRRLQPTPDASN